MTKYIRTKDYVYDTEKLIYGKIEGNKLYRVGWDVEKPTFEADIIKQSDNIKELCDVFVYVDTKHNILKYKYMIRNSLCDNDMKYMKMGTEIYGAIWTDKGLIYVAKMDNKGELELI